MGKFDFEIPKEFMNEIKKLEKYDDIQEKMLSESASILVENMKKVLKKHKQTGDMIKSVKANAPSIKDSTWSVFVSPTGYSKTQTFVKGNKTYKLSNAAKLLFLQYGTSHQKADPVLEEIKNDSEKEILNKMQEVFNREVGQ